MSFHEKTESIVKQACVYELAQAVMEHGDKFNSMHEGWAILKEEMEEVAEEYEKVKSFFDKMWYSIKMEDFDGSLLEFMQLHIIFAMKELAQVWAVCEKMKEGVEE